MATIGGSETGDNGADADKGGRSGEEAVPPDAD